ncbi:hypothetical protein PALA37_02671 [Pseudomonas aeruginosa]|nr:hypothetical protein PALA37_02671 [Pseudomonas aeruginosa]SQL02467.1 Uncharacterised protein [Pseudomonas aeruginosa]
MLMCEPIIEETRQALFTGGFGCVGWQLLVCHASLGQYVSQHI